MECHLSHIRNLLRQDLVARSSTLFSSSFAPTSEHRSGGWPKVEKEHSALLLRRTCKLHLLATRQGAMKALSDLSKSAGRRCGQNLEALGSFLVVKVLRVMVVGMDPAVKLESGSRVRGTPPPNPQAR